MSNKDSVKHIFPLAKKGEFGYDCEQVNEFLAKARDTYEQLQDSPTDALLAKNLRESAFAVVKEGGYATRYVDAALERLEDVLNERELVNSITDPDDERAVKAEKVELLKEVKKRAVRARGQKFRRRGFFASGYSRAQVDVFVEQAIDSLQQPKNREISVAQIRESVFHNQWRGYDEAQVDAFLDALIELYLYSR